MKVVLVGIAPARPGEEGQPLSAYAPQSTGRRIANMMKMSWKEYNDFFDRVNVCPHPQLSTIPAKLYHPFAENLAGILRNRRVILLGANVAECFSIPRESWEPCRWRVQSETYRQVNFVGYRAGMKLPFDWALLPHPSGRNRWYNAPENERTAIEFLESLKTS